MSKIGISLILAMWLLSGAAIGAVALERGADEGEPMASFMPIEELAFPSIPPQDSGPATFTWDAEQWDHTQDSESGLELQILRIEATEPRANGWAFVLNDIAVFEDGDHEHHMVGSLAKLSNDGGAWVGSWRALGSKARPDSSTETSPGWRRGEFAELAGEEGYEGMTMYLFMFIGDDVREGLGFIVPTDAIPPFPEPPAE